MKVTIHFNNGMTFASIGYGLLLAPMFSDDSSPLLIETMFPENVVCQIIVGILSVVSAIVASMYIVKALWNRLFPSLCGRKEISPAESYAMSLFIGIFLIQ
jgi:hypothetical protein